MWTLIPGVPIGCRSPRKRGPYSMPIHMPFRARWKPPSDLREWEGPFTGEEKRAPQHPLVREKQREACRRWREKRRAAGLKVRSEPTERRRAQTREATRRWRERKPVSALEAAGSTRDDGAQPAKAAEPRPANSDPRPDDCPACAVRPVCQGYVPNSFKREGPRLSCGCARASSCAVSKASAVARSLKSVPVPSARRPCQPITSISSPAAASSLSPSLRIAQAISGRCFLK